MAPHITACVPGAALTVLCAWLRSDRLHVDPKEHPLLLAEPSFQPREAREQVVSRVFEGYAAPALFLAKNAALSSYATGRQTSLVVDMGHEGTVGAPATPPPARALTPLGDVCLHKSAMSHRVNVQPEHTATAYDGLQQPDQQTKKHQHTQPPCRAPLPQIKSFSIASFSCWICDFSWLPSFVVTEQEMTCAATPASAHGARLQRCTLDDGGRSPAWLRHTPGRAQPWRAQTRTARSAARMSLCVRGTGRTRPREATCMGTRSHLVLGHQRHMQQNFTSLSVG